MRETKCRGKRVDNNQWVYGDFVRSLSRTDGGYEAWIKPRDILGLGTESTPTSNFFKVHPESVGWWAGRHDKNGKEIYEGALLHINFGIPPTVALLEVYFDKGRWMTRRLNHSEEQECPLYDLSMDDIYLVGSIHENPELEVKE